LDANMNVLRNLRRRIIRNFLDILILSMLRDNPYITGYNVITFIRKKYGVLISTGAAYSTLYSMERRGLIRGTLKGKKRFYSISPKGKEFIRVITDNSNIITELTVAILNNHNNKMYLPVRNQKPAKPSR